MKKILLTFGLLGLIVLWGCTNNETNIRVERCEQVALENLKAPGNAVFWEKPIVVKDTIHGYSIKNHVDSQNSYGALLRCEFICRFDINDSVKVLFKDDSIDWDNLFYDLLNETRFSLD